MPYFKDEINDYLKKNFNVDTETYKATIVSGYLEFGKWWKTETLVTIATINHTTKEVIYGHGYYNEAQTIANRLKYKLI